MKNMTVSYVFSIRCHQCKANFTVETTLGDPACPHCAEKEIAGLQKDLAESKKLLEEANALLARKKNVTVGDGEKSLFENILDMEKVLKNANISITFNEGGIANTVEK